MGEDGNTFICSVDDDDDDVDVDVDVDDTEDEEEDDETRFTDELSASSSSPSPSGMNMPQPFSMRCFFNVRHSVQERMTDTNNIQFFKMNKMVEDLDVRHQPITGIVVLDAVLLKICYIIMLKMMIHRIFQRFYKSLHQTLQYKSLK